MKRTVRQVGYLQSWDAKGWWIRYFLMCVWYSNVTTDCWRLSKLQTPSAPVQIISTYKQ